MSETVTTGIDVTVTEAQRQKLCGMAPDVRATEAISGIATGLLQDMADGGMMLNTRTVVRLAAALGSASFSEADLIAAAEKGVRRYGQATVVEYSIDPVYVAPLAEWSRSNGRTVQELVQDCMHQAFDQEWFYSMSFERRQLSLTVEKYREVATALGKEIFFGEDLADAVLAGMAPPELEVAGVETVRR